MTVKNDFSVPWKGVFGETPGREIKSGQKIVLNRHFVLPHRRSAVKPGLAWARSARRARLRRHFRGSSQQAGSLPEAPDRGLRGTIRRTRVRVNPGLTAESPRTARSGASEGPAHRGPSEAPGQREPNSASGERGPAPTAVQHGCRVQRKDRRSTAERKEGS